jgi:hypothetical protein
LANQLPSEFPPYIPDTSLRIPTVLPEPLPPLAPTHEPTSAVGRLERLISATPRGEETDAAWKAGIENVFRQLNAGKKLAGGVRLGLVVSPTLTLSKCDRAHTTVSRRSKSCEQVSESRTIRSGQQLIAHRLDPRWYMAQRP